MLMQEFVNNVAIITTSFIIIVFSSFVSEKNEAPKQISSLKIEQIKLKHELDPNRPIEPPTEIRIGGSYIKNQDSKSFEASPDTKINTNLLNNFKSIKNPDLAYHAIELDYTKLDVKKQAQGLSPTEKIDDSEAWLKDDYAQVLKTKCQKAEKDSENMLKRLKARKKTKTTQAPNQD